MSGKLVARSLKDEWGGRDWNVWKNLTSSGDCALRSSRFLDERNEKVERLGDCVNVKDAVCRTMKTTFKTLIPN